MYTLRILLLLSIIIAGCGEPTKKWTFDLDGQSKLYLFNATPDSLDIRIRDIAIWPEKSHYLVYTLAPGEHKLEERKAQGRNDFYLYVNSQNFNLYNSPGSVDTITINPGKSGKVLLT
ncbi:MAG: hypothetical protein RJQ14_00810, partial [Marinoscillum sp.]